MNNQPFSKSARVCLALFGFVLLVTGFLTWQQIAVTENPIRFFGRIVALALAGTGIGYIFFPRKLMEYGKQDDTNDEKK